ncbi:uncharacterized protein LOC142344265 isoform X2 [Convolutriloba macropyga]|uniref:uncharacterized protein LOC142344265 isoform X2 n=1 Tax=Convolutriloba macropyga TaxID=536237 RepID=UPI003F51BD46
MDCVTVIKSHNLRAIFVVLVLVSAFIMYSSPTMRVNDRLSQLIYGQTGYMPEIKCRKRVTLPYFEEKYSTTNQQLFFIEPTFDERVLPGRKVCAIESAILNSQLPVKVLFTADQLHFGNMSSFCRLVEEYYPERLELFTIDVASLFHTTPLDGFLPLWEKSLADTPPQLGAVGMISKYYQMSDLLSKPNNCNLPDRSQSSAKVNGGVIHVNAGSPLIWKVMQLCKDRFELSRAGFSANKTKNGTAKMIADSGDYKHDVFGAPMITEAVKYFLSLPHLANVTNGVYEGFTIEPAFKFMPVLRPGLSLFGKTASQKTNTDWEEVFRCSLTVHLIGPLSKIFPIIMPRSTSPLAKEPKINFSHPGLEGYDVYSYLGPRVCPKSFSNLRMFK